MSEQRFCLQMRGDFDMSARNWGQLYFHEYISKSKQQVLQWWNNDGLWTFQSTKRKMRDCDTCLFSRQWEGDNKQKMELTRCQF